MNIILISVSTKFMSIIAVFTENNLPFLRALLKSIIFGSIIIASLWIILFPMHFTFVVVSSRLISHFNFHDCLIG